MKLHTRRGVDSSISLYPMTEKLHMSNQLQNRLAIAVACCCLNISLQILEMSTNIIQAFTARAPSWFLVDRFAVTNILPGFLAFS